MQTRKLYTALTREPQALGISFPMLILIGLGSVIVFLGTGNLFTILVGVPFYFVARYMNNKDSQLLNVIIKKYQKTPPVKNRDFWNGSNSYDTNLNNDK